MEGEAATFRQGRSEGIKPGADGRLTPPPGPKVIEHAGPIESFAADRDRKS